MLVDFEGREHARLCVCCGLLLMCILCFGVCVRVYVCFDLCVCLCVRGLLEKYPTFGREKETGLLGALDT